ncbi:hypothetical protein [Chryseobacterium sp. LAM-KRS1]|uniref:hypothetical protein n=1 Tax=Chryseobacterium sp. LAM-KRS1 TaxID=2715754 RepID=UPI0015528A2C|nr:hypothetical protein [Chryseobacterium sp. LAM-KRS1]
MNKRNNFLILTITLFCIVVILGSCNTKLKGTSFGESSKENDTISYKELMTSMDNAITFNENKLNEYEIANLKDYLRNFLKNDYKELKKESTYTSRDNIKEFFILEYEEGEVVLLNFHYVFIEGSKAKHFFINNNGLVKTKAISKDDLNYLNVVPIKSKNLKKVILLSEVKNKKLRTSLGNSDNILNNILN